jgi:ankyrin repeat domain-containing protein 50
MRSVKETINRFPTKIEDMYQQTWERIMNQDPEHKALAKAALLWVLHAKRTLSLQELCHAIATCPVTHNFEEDRLIPGTTIIDLCHGLLIVDKKSRFVRLVRECSPQTCLDLF